ncbi:MAG: cation transporter [Flavobacteriales bacterium]|nr:cation transporter [Flavobacteriales bacterium]MCW8913593.1 cation transporter [Flavobacteriales bacterium]MCW8938662.1 cation transporter [Flavobacteriales bacterium]MCW8940193.1 cation transporter [Flavobacteriales bacterium]MCW8967851.1 cation transporter [Flavobacteriales bacterium]
MNINNYFLVLITASLGFFAACNNAAENNEEITTEKSVIDESKVLAVDYKIDGMTCKMGCAKTIEKTVAGLNGVVSSTVDFDTEKGHFEFDASIISEKEIISAIEKVADQYKVEEWKEEKDTSKENIPSETKNEDKSVTNVKMPTFEIPNIFELLINQL